MNNNNDPRFSGISAEKKNLEYQKAKSEAEKRKAMLEAEKRKRFGKAPAAYGLSDNSPRDKAERTSQRQVGRPSQPTRQSAYAQPQRTVSPQAQRPVPPQAQRPVSPQAQRPVPPQSQGRPATPQRGGRVNYHDPRDVERKRQNARADSKAEGLQRQLGKKPDPKKKIEQSRAQSTTQTRRPERQHTRPAPKNEQPQSEWVIPDRSPNYPGANSARPSQPSGQPQASGRNVSPERKDDDAREAEKIKQQEKMRKDKTDSIVGGITRFFITFIVCLLVLSLVSFWIYRAVYFSKPVSAHNVTYTYIDEEFKSKKVKVKAATAFKDGVQYVNFNELADLFDMSKIGSLDYVRYIITDNGNSTERTGREQTVSFAADKKIAVVNGTNIVLENLCRFQNGNVWIPLSFATNYINGVEITTDRNGSTVFSIGYESDEIETTETAETDEEDDVADTDETTQSDETDKTLIKHEVPENRISFKVSSSVPLTPIDYDKADIK